MKLHTVFVTYNRLELTKQAIQSYLDTVTAEKYVAWVVDNASTDGTQEWLREEFLQGGVGDRGITLHPENRYPGRACNEGWQMSEHAQWDELPTHLHRADNDFIFLPGWCNEAEERFAENPRLGQLGLRTDEEDGYALWNVGGNNIIRRELWDAGLRYDETPWPEYPAGYSEDSYFSPKVKEMGWEWGRVQRPCIRNIASGDWSDPYYAESYGVRGIRPSRQDPTVPPDWDWSK